MPIECTGFMLFVAMEVDDGILMAMTTTTTRDDECEFALLSDHQLVVATGLEVGNVRVRGEEEEEGDWSGDAIGDVRERDGVGHGNSPIPAGVVVVVEVVGRVDKGRFGVVEE